MRKIASARELFDRAWTAAKATWKIVLPLVAVIQVLSYGLSQLVQVLPLPELLKSFLSLFVSVVIAVLTVGVLNGVLGYLRGKPLTHACIGSMLPHVGKVICLDLWMGLCVLAWVLPGMGGMMVGGMLMALGQKVLLLAILGGLMSIAGLAAVFVLAIYAGYGYSMGNCILIDAPASGARNILKQSKAMMHGYRWHYFKVGLPVFLGIFVITLVIGLLSSALPAWLTSLIFLPLNVAVSALSPFTLAVMYEELKRIGR